MLRAMYEILLHLFALVAIPRMIYQRLFHGKYKNSLALRFGLGFPVIHKGKRRLIWMHAVSVGETKAIAALAKLLKNAPDNPLLLISSTTETGHSEAKRSISFADFHVYLPLDFAWMVGPIVQRTEPDQVILSETDFWYNFLHTAKEGGATISVVNGKISTRSSKRFKLMRGFAHGLFGLVDLFCVQNQLYKERFLALDVPESKIVVTGNMKFDEEYPQLSPDELRTWREQVGIAPKQHVLVIGSTHDPEENLILDVLEQVWKQFPNLKVLLVPRHPERFNEVANLLAKREIPYIRFSNLDAKTGDERVVLVDAMGVLRKCYQFADIAIVAGSYTQRIGGHNVVEPCGYGVPVLFGPYTHTQTELVSLVKEYGAGLEVPIDKLAETLITHLQHPEKRAVLGKAGSRLIADMKGATLNTYNALQRIPAN